MKVKAILKIILVVAVVGVAVWYIFTDIQAQSKNKQQITTGVSGSIQKYYG